MTFVIFFLNWMAVSEPNMPLSQQTHWQKNQTGYKHRMDVKEGDKVASIARTATAELKKVGAEPNGEPLPTAGEQFKLPMK
ncbi:MAG: hypothetical protein HY781_00200 [Chloroflexi bacterium]|nr:hypothetical protein [Chloroflexota bacterium]